jgi:hypothetical protein
LIAEQDRYAELIRAGLVRVVLEAHQVEPQPFAEQCPRYDVPWTPALRGDERPELNVVTAVGRRILSVVAIAAGGARPRTAGLRASRFAARRPSFSLYDATPI